MLAARAGLIERKADRIALEARNEATRLNAGPIIEQLVDRVEEAVDELEQAAFIASLAPAGHRCRAAVALAELCAVAITATEAAASGLPRRSKSRKATAPIPRTRWPRWSG